MRNEVESLLTSVRNGEVSQYRITKDCKLPVSTLTPYLNGKSDIGNMRLSLAEKLSTYYKEVVNKL